MLPITGPNTSTPRARAKDATRPVNHCMAAIPRNMPMVKTDIASISIPTDKAVTLGVMVGELVTNAIKYAYSAGTTGEIRLGFGVQLRERGVRVFLGCGLEHRPESPARPTPRRPKVHEHGVVGRNGLGEVVLGQFFGNQVLNVFNK